MRKIDFWAFFTSNCSYDGTFFKGLKVGRFEKMPLPPPTNLEKYPPPKSIFLSNRDLLSSTLLTFLLDTNFDLEFFDIFRHFSSLLSSTFSNFELGIVILSLVLRFQKKIKHTYFRAKKSKK